jgi:hypothetical protein
MFHNNCSYYNIVYIGQLGIFCGQKLHEEITHCKRYRFNILRSHIINILCVEYVHCT